MSDLATPRSRHPSWHSISFALRYEIVPLPPATEFDRPHRPRLILASVLGPILSLSTNAPSRGLLHLRTLSVSRRSCTAAVPSPPDAPRICAPKGAESWHLSPSRRAKLKESRLRPTARGPPASCAPRLPPDSPPSSLPSSGFSPPPPERLPPPRVPRRGAVASSWQGRPALSQQLRASWPRLIPALAGWHRAESLDSAGDTGSGVRPHADAAYARPGASSAAASRSGGRSSALSASLYSQHGADGRGGELCARAPCAPASLAQSSLPPVSLAPPPTSFFLRVQPAPLRPPFVPAPPAAPARVSRFTSRPGCLYA